MNVLKARNGEENMLCIKAIFIGTMLLLASVVPAIAATNDNDNVSKLISNGAGKAMAVPDVVTITLGVETRNASASVAASENALLMNRTVSALLSAGVSRKDIQTSSYSLAAQTEDNQAASSGTGNKTRPPDFIAANLVTVRMNVSEDIGKVLDAAIAVGSNSVAGISFELRDDKQKIDQALSEAILDASRKAEVMAVAAGVKLGRVLEISEGYSFTSSNAPMAAYSVAAATTPVLPGELEISASVTMTYEITKIVKQYNEADSAAGD
jgi:uncharacterized protein YggE